METLIFETDLKVFGIEVKTFPAGIDEAFKELIKQTGDDAGERNYYGVSSMKNDGKMIYKAVAEEKYEGESKKYNYPESAIEKGEYLFETVKDWRNKTHCIKDVFEEMMKDKRVNLMKPCVEWYKNEDEMLCMVKAL
jgi:predicted transcriptional regulator YdeE